MATTQTPMGTCNVVTSATSQDGPSDGSSLTVVIRNIVAVLAGRSPRRGSTASGAVTSQGWPLAAHQQANCVLATTAKVNPGGGAGPEGLRQAVAAETKPPETNQNLPLTHSTRPPPQLVVGTPNGEMGGEGNA
jgi:hypothetical protein